jgi:hypothetical protein
MAARASIGKGTVIAVADPSILINSMVGRGDNEVFLRELFSWAGEKPEIFIDTSRLPKVPLDRSKDAWETARGRMSIPYVQVLMTAALLATIFVPLWRKGEKIEQE